MKLMMNDCFKLNNIIIELLYKNLVFNFIHQTIIWQWQTIVLKGCCWGIKKLLEFIKNIILKFIITQRRPYWENNANWILMPSYFESQNLSNKLFRLATSHNRVMLTKSCLSYKDEAVKIASKKASTHSLPSLKRPNDLQTSWKDG